MCVSQINVSTIYEVRRLITETSVKKVIHCKKVTREFYLLQLTLLPYLHTAAYVHSFFRSIAVAYHFWEQIKVKWNQIWQIRRMFEHRNALVLPTCFLSSIGPFLFCYWLTLPIQSWCQSKCCSSWPLILECVFSGLFLSLNFVNFSNFPFSSCSHRSTGTCSSLTFRIQNEALVTKHCHATPPLSF